MAAKLVDEISQRKYIKSSSHQTEYEAPNYQGSFNPVVKAEYGKAKVGKDTGFWNGM